MKAAKTMTGARAAAPKTTAKEKTKKARMVR
jgi:hypothetical protein